MIEWRDVDESPRLYQISNIGGVRRKGCELCSHELSVRIGSVGYRQVSIYLPNGRQVSRTIHRLIAKAFIPNPRNLPAVNHKDGDKANSSIENLEWVSYSENTKHAYARGLIKPSSGNDHWTRNKPELKTSEWRGKKLDAAAVIKIRHDFKAFHRDRGIGPLAKKYGVSRAAISHAVHGITWGNI